MCINDLRSVFLVKSLCVCRGLSCTFYVGKCPSVTVCLAVVILGEWQCVVVSTVRSVMKLFGC